MTLMLNLAINWSVIFVQPVGMLPAVSLYSNSRETSPPPEYKDQHCILLAVALMGLIYYMAVEQKSM